jgi:hypothetical protein
MHVPHTAMPALIVVLSTSTFSAHLHSFLTAFAPIRVALLQYPVRYMAVP